MRRVLSHRRGSIVFGIVVGLLTATWAYQWISNPNKRTERVEQERVVNASREILANRLLLQQVEIVDPVAPNRKVGKVYVYPVQDGWEVSGYFRREEGDRWHPYLIAMDDDLELIRMKVQDTDEDLVRRATQDIRIEVSH